MLKNIPSFIFSAAEELSITFIQSQPLRTELECLFQKDLPDDIIDAYE